MVMRPLDKGVMRPLDVEAKPYRWVVADTKSRRVLGNPNYNGAKPVHQIISMIKWIRTSSFSKRNSLSGRYHIVSRPLLDYREPSPIRFGPYYKGTSPIRLTTGVPRP